MPAAVLAEHFGAPHEQAAVLAHLDVLGHRRLVEARPSGARIELGVGAEQLRAAARAPVRAVLLDVDVLTGERPLGAVLAQDLVLLGRKPLSPLIVGELHLAPGVGFAFGCHGDYGSAVPACDTVNTR